MITFYQLEWCPDCHRVRQVMTELELTYVSASVSADKEKRPEVIAVSGQSSVPMLQDGDKVFTSSDEIMEYLRATYPVPEDAAEHARRGAWRTSHTLSVPPRAALARLTELLEANDFTIVAQTRGPEIDERLPEEYVLLQVAVPAAAAKAFKLDPRAPTAMLLPIAVVPAEGGGSVIAGADPVAQIWLFGTPGLRNVQHGVKKRLGAVLKEL
jgi:glutathione S-transferase